MNYRQQMIAELAKEIKDSGYRVFISGNGEYGFYTDIYGARVISFGCDLGSIRFSGNYKTNQPANTGTGWRICEDSKNFSEIFSTIAPRWAVGSAKWAFTTLEQYLDTYQSSSKFKEI